MDDMRVIVGKIVKEHVRKVAIFRALQLGDMLCLIPAVRAFKKQYPDSDLTLIGLPWAEDFVRRFPHYFSSFIPFPGYPGLAEQPFDSGKFEKFLLEVNEERFDLIIQMHGNGSITNRVVHKMYAKIRAGYLEKKNESCGNLFMPYPEGVHEVERHLRLMSFLGISLQGNELEFPITESEQERFRGLCDELDLKNKRYVCIHPGARDEKRRWLPQYFARVADSIANNGYQIVLTGAASEIGVVEKVEKMMCHPVLNLSGKTALGVLAALIKNCGLLICNDTGVSHIAAAVVTPSIVVFLVSDPTRWAPLDQELHQVIPPEESGDIDHVLFEVKRKLLNRKFDNNSLRVA